MHDILATSSPSGKTAPSGDDIRVDIASALADVLAMTDDSVTDAQRAFTCDMISALVPYLPEPFLVDFSDRLSRRQAPAGKLLQLMLTQPIDIARPMLERLSDIPDGLLIEAMAVSPAHQRVIAARFRISERVADKLFEMGSQALRVSLLARDEVPLAPHRVAWLVELTREETALRMPLLNRHELQPGDAFRMFWWCDQDQRARIFSRFALSREPLQNMLELLYVRVFTDPNSDPVARGILSLCDRRHRPRNRAGDVVPMPQVEQFLEAVRAHPTGELRAATGVLAGISRATATEVISDPSGEPFAVLCKSLGVSRGAFASILERAAERRAEDPSAPGLSAKRREQLLATFDTIARDYARTVLRYWDWQHAMSDLRKAESGLQAQ